MRKLLGGWMVLLVAHSVLQAATPEYQPVSDWLQPGHGMPTIGAAHGDVAVSSTGEVFVSVLSGPGAGIQVFAADGKYLRNLPNAPADFHGFVIRKGADGEHLYGASLGEGTIFKMKLDGEVVLKIPPSTIPEKLIRKQKDKLNLRLTAVDVAPDGRIFAVDGYASDQIHLFDASGKYLQSFGGKEPPYSFKTCHKIAIDTRFDPAQILCCDRENRRLVHLSLDGKVLGVTPDMNRPAAAVVFGEWAAIAEIEGRISLLDRQHKTVLTLGTNPVKEQTATNKVEPSEWKTGIVTAPHGIDFDDQGNLYVSEYNLYGRVLRYNHDSK